ncbi:MAG: RNA methyltransferase [Parachlamydiales bacterium]|jgi:TrmH family RNA methyltransferase
MLKTEEELSSLHNPKLKRSLALYKKNVRDESGLFLIEGYRELFRALEGNVAIEELFFCPEFFLGSNEDKLIEKIALAAPAYRCFPKVFAKLSYRDRPDGLIAVARQKKLSLGSLKALLKNSARPPFLVIAESIEKPGNLGTILRSSDGAGADALILADEKTDLHNPNVVRASVGTLFTLPVVSASSQETLAFLKAEKIRLVAATPQSDLLYTRADLRGPLAIAVGTEQLGLSRDWLNEAELKVKIPMLGKADSLNVASATTLVLYEVLRQRS